MQVPMQVDRDGRATVCIHLVVPTDERRTGWRIVCMPHLTEAEMCQQHYQPSPRLRTDDIGAVTCMNCKHTKEYDDLAAKNIRRMA